MGGDERRHQPIKKPPAIAGRAGKESIHGWGQPEHAQIIAHRLDRAGIGAIDAHPPPAIGQSAGADIGRPGIGLDRRRHRPGQVRAQPLQGLETGSAQPAPWRQDRNGLKQIGLARAIGPGQYDMARIEIERGRSVIAKGGEAQARDVADHGH